MASSSSGSPAGTPHSVTLGRGGDVFVRLVEDMPDEVLDATHSLFRNDATDAVRAIVGPSLSGGVVEIPVSERRAQH